MTLETIRKDYPEYDDMTDEEFVEATGFEETEEPEVDETPQVLYDISSKMEELCKAICAIAIPDTNEVNQSMLETMKQIKNQLKTVETAIKSIDVNVNVPAPIVNVPKADKVTVPAVVFPETPKEWVFEIKRDRNGYIHSVTARA